jgi:hypothetical protein
MAIHMKTGYIYDISVNSSAREKSYRGKTHVSNDVHILESCAAYEIITENTTKPDKP